MALRPSIQALVDQIEQLRHEQVELIEMRCELFRGFRDLASRQMELKARLEHERAKFKKRGWMD